jgi:cellulose synthase/poly-beta-1,6-N-acetylglucosamine synthase-like glycosyltransferase
MVRYSVSRPSYVPVRGAPVRFTRGIEPILIKAPVQRLVIHEVPLQTPVESTPPVHTPIIGALATKTLVSFEVLIDSRSLLEHDGVGKLCLLIPAHNESLVIQNTIRSAIASGMNPEDIYVVNDDSYDDTAHLAAELLGRFNVLTVERSGKGLAIEKAAAAFMLPRRYEWIHIADADGAFHRDYFAKFRLQLNAGYAAATGYLKSAKGSYIGKFRVFEYALGMEVTRRVQVLMNTIQVIPGATSCLRSDVFEQLDFNGGTVTEDYDVTLQIHRQGLGKIQFIPGAVAYTQDPESFRDFIKQITRWYRGGVECMLKHQIGSRVSRIDFYISFQIFQNFLFLSVLLVVMPITALLTHSIFGYAMLFIWDVATMLMACLLIALKVRRWDILSAFPLLYGLKWVNTYAFTKAIVGAMFKRQTFTHRGGAWTSPTRVAT